MNHNMIKWNNKYMCMHNIFCCCSHFIILRTCTTTLCALQFNKQKSRSSLTKPHSFKIKHMIVHYWHYQCVHWSSHLHFLMNLIPNTAFLQVMCVVRWRRNSPRVLVCPGNTAWQNSHTCDCSVTPDMNSPPAWLTNSLSRNEDDQGLCGTEKQPSHTCQMLWSCRRCDHKQE